MRRVLLLALTAGISIPLVACSPKKKISLDPVVVETLIIATESWNGDSFKYPKGQAEMKLEKITAQQGFKTPLHLHPRGHSPLDEHLKGILQWRPSNPTKKMNYMDA